MSTDDDSDPGLGLVLALMGAGVALAWWLWRSGSSRKPGSGTGDLSTPTREVVIRICVGDRVSVNGAEVDLPAAVERARHATLVDVFPRGDARHGWVEDVQAALQAAGVHYVFHPLPHRTPQS